MKNRYALALMGGLVLLGVVLVGGVFAADVNSPAKLYDHSQLQCHVGTASINSANATWTNWTALITIAPPSGMGLMRARAVIDLNKATTGFATRCTSETITITVARKVDGSNWRVANNVATTAISGTNSTGQALELNIGEVGPTEQVAVYAKMSSTTGILAITLPYVVYYSSGAPATLTLAQ